MQQKLKRITLLIVFFILCGVIGGGTTSLIIRYVQNSGNDAFHPVLVGGAMVAFVAISVLLHVIIHETGHFVGGYFSGYRFSSFRIFNLVLVKEKNRYRIKRNSLPGTGGQCLMAPPATYHEAIPYKLYFLGGGLSNVFTSIAAFVALLLLQDNLLLSLFLAVYGIIGLIVGLTNLIPMQLGGIDNDGKNLQLVSQSRENHYSIWIQLQYAHALAENRLIEEMPEAWFRKPANLDNTIGINRLLFMVDRAMSVGDFSAAKEYCLEALNCLPDNSLLATHTRGELVYLSVLEGNEKEVVEDYYTPEVKQYFKATQNTPSTLRIEYAYLVLIEKDHEKAAQHLQKFEKVTATFPYAGVNQLEQRLIERVNNMNQ